MRSIILLLLLFPTGALSWVQTQGEETGALYSWPRRCIPYALNEQGSRGLPIEAVESAIVASYAAWQAPGCSDLELHYQGRSDETEIEFDQTGNNTILVIWIENIYEWEHEPGVIGVTTVTSCQNAEGFCPYAGAIMDADMELNGADFQFTVSDQDVHSDIQNTVTHEVGHVIGLDHPPNKPHSTMFATAPEGEIKKRSLNSDDIEGLCTIYPAYDGGPPPCESFEDPITNYEEPSCQFGGLQGRVGWGALLLSLLVLLGLTPRRGPRWLQKDR